MRISEHDIGCRCKTMPLYKQLNESTYSEFDLQVAVCFHTLPQRSRSYSFVGQQEARSIFLAEEIGQMRQLRTFPLLLDLE